MSRRKKNEEDSPLMQRAKEYGYVIIGAAFVALAFNLFLLPNRVASGGVSGISTILNAVLGWEPGIVQLSFNIPLFFAGVVLLGRQFGLKTLVGTVTLPLMVLWTRDIQPATMDPLLASLFGGIGVGIGLGLVFRGRASTGGTDLAAQIIHKYTGLSLGTCVAIIDGLIVISAAIVFDIELGLYALLSLYVTSKTIDMVQVGIGYSKTIIIISEKEAEVREAILTKLDRGVTKLTAHGGYTLNEKPVLMCVVNQQEFTKLKQVVQSIDASAFVVVMNASEVLGEGFKRE